MAFTATEIEEINQIIRDWGKSVMGEAHGLTPRSTGNLQSKLKVVFKQDGGGMIWKVAYQFPRYGVFVEQGVFGGLSIEEARKAGKTRPRPWLNATIQEKLSLLEGRIAQKNLVLVSRAIEKSLIKNQGTDV